MAGLAVLLAWFLLAWFLLACLSARPCSAQSEARPSEANQSEATRTEPAARSARIDLVVPTADYCQPDDMPPLNRPVIDILQNGRVECDGKLVYDPAKTPLDYRSMHKLLLDLKARPEIRTVTERVGGKELQLVDEPILIRADRHTEWHFVGTFMAQCAKPDVAFWKIELGVADGDGADGDGPAILPSYLPRDVGGAEPVETLKVGIVCEQWGTEVARKASAADGPAVLAFELQGHEIYWTVGPTKVGTGKELQAELQRVANDEDTWHPDPRTGILRPMRVVVAPKVGVTYGDTIRTMDAVKAAGFMEINLGGGLGARKR